jgi:hypothetical protein
MSLDVCFWHLAAFRTAASASAITAIQRNAERNKRFMALNNGCREARKNRK